MPTKELPLTDAETGPEMGVEMGKGSTEPELACPPW